MLKYTSTQDYNIIAGLVALPFVFDMQFYAVTFVGAVITLGLSVAQYRTNTDYVRPRQGHVDLEPMKGVSFWWKLKLSCINNPFYSMYIHLCLR